MDWTAIPVIINNRNRLEVGFKELVDWLIRAGCRRIEIIDNCSSYQPLLDWYKTCGLKIHSMPVNMGPGAPWGAHIVDSLETPYIVTDPDVVPTEQCPMDLIPKMLEVFDRYRAQGCTKVGPGIRIDNLPDHYVRKNEVKQWEEVNFSKLMPEGDAFQAGLDTTFALYYSNVRNEWHTHYRLVSPYVVEHKPWYLDSANLPYEEIYYRKCCENGWSYWCR